MPTNALPIWWSHVGRAIGLLACVALLVCAGRATAHELPIARSVIVSVHAERVDVLVVYEMGSSSEARQLRETVDLNRDGAIAGPWERIALAQLLTPRLLEALELTVDGRTLSLRLVGLEIRDGPFDGDRTGFVAMALYTSPPVLGERMPGAPDVELEVVETEHIHLTTRVEMQASDGLVIRHSSLRTRPGDPVHGPNRLRTGRAQVAVFGWEP